MHAHVRLECFTCPCTTTPCFFFFFLSFFSLFSRTPPFFSRSALPASCGVTFFWCMYVRVVVVVVVVCLFGWLVGTIVRGTLLFGTGRCKASVLFFRHWVGETVLPSFVPSLFVQVRPRRSTETPSVAVPGTAAYAAGATPAALTAEERYALFFLSRRLTSEPKIVVNARVVVVGASDTSLSLLETLLMRPYLHFTSIVVVAPEGLNDDGEGEAPVFDHEVASWTLGSLYSAADVRRLAFSVRARVPCSFQFLVAPKPLCGVGVWCFVPWLMMVGGCHAGPCPCRARKGCRHRS